VRFRSSFFLSRNGDGPTVAEPSLPPERAGAHCPANSRGRRGHSGMAALNPKFLILPSIGSHSSMRDLFDVIYRGPRYYSA